MTSSNQNVVTTVSVQLESFVISTRTVLIATVVITIVGPLVLVSLVPLTQNVVRATTAVITSVVVVVRAIRVTSTPTVVIRSIAAIANVVIAVSDSHVTTTQTAVITVNIVAMESAEKKNVIYLKHGLLSLSYSVFLLLSELLLVLCWFTTGRISTEDCQV